MEELQGIFFHAELQRLQAPRRENLTYGSCRGSQSEWPKRDAVKDSNTLWEQEQVLWILEQIPWAQRSLPGEKRKSYLRHVSSEWELAMISTDCVE